MSTRIAINGAAGRMGQRLVVLGSQDAELEICAALEHAEHPHLGTDAGIAAGSTELGVPLTHALEVAVETVIDFSLPVAASAITKTCRENKIPLVMATTGLNAEQQQLVREAAHVIPLVFAPNMSLAVNLTMKLASLAAQTLKENDQRVDVEIIERHHRFKEDAPSGTALRFGHLIADIMGQSKHQHGRQGQTGQRPADEIGYHSLRVGDNPGEHTVVFAILGECIELTVKSSDRDAYALGALAAAKFVANRPPGLYTMDDVFGL